MATISIFRESSYSGMLREVKIMLDGVEAGRIKQGQSLDLSVSPGQYTVRCAMDWCGSRTLSLQLSTDDTALSLVCKVRGSLSLLDIANWLTAGRNDYIELRHE